MLGDGRAGYPGAAAGPVGASRFSSGVRIRDLEIPYFMCSLRRRFGRGNSTPNAAPRQRRSDRRLPTRPDQSIRGASADSIFGTCSSNRWPMRSLRNVVLLPPRWSAHQIASSRERDGPHGNLCLDQYTRVSVWPPRYPGFLCWVEAHMGWGREFSRSCIRDGDGRDHSRMPSSTEMLLSHRYGTVG